MSNLQEFLVGLRVTLSGDIAARVVIAAALAFFLIVFVTAAVMLARTLTPQGRLRALLEAQADRERGPAWAMRIVGLALVVFALFGTEFYLGSSSTCQQCHQKSPEAKALASTPHKSVACGDCHSGPGPTGGLQLGVDYLRWTYAWVTVGKMPKNLTAEVGSQPCVGCHRDIGPTRTVRGLRVRHSDFLAEGAKCESCHARIAHPGVKDAAEGPEMSSCLPCHDGQTASADCVTCHTKDIAQRDRDGVQMAQLQVSGSKDSCYTCHDPKPCDRCHGTRMPHPDKWSPRTGDQNGGRHARAAFVNLDSCWRCHFDGKPGVPTKDGCNCHQLVAKGGMHGGPAWVQEHGLQATGKKEGAIADCFSCHGSQFCDNCHPPGYQKLYNPKLGVDHYDRNKPLDPKWLDQ